jgi:hypothetical protein
MTAVKSLGQDEIRALFSPIDSPYATHRQALCEAIVRTTGLVLELGMGDSSTPSLHDLASLTGRSVYSFDHDLAWVERFRGFQSANHQIGIVASWDECPIETMFWSAALVDHAPAERRIVDIQRLVNRAQVLVVHDTEDPSYGYDQIFGAFKYRVDFRDQHPWTTLLSNFVDVSRWTDPPSEGS